MTQTNDPPTVLDIGLIPNSNEKADLNAPSDSGGKLVIGQAPNITITETTVVADADERLALDVQEGDIAIQTNVSTSFIFTGGDNVANNWETLDFDAVGAIDGEDITPRDITATGDISLQDLTVAGAINGADTAAAAAGEALTADGTGGFSFAAAGGNLLSSIPFSELLNIDTAFDIIVGSQTAMQELAASQTSMQQVVASQTAMQEVAASQIAMQEVIASPVALDEVVNSQTAMQEVAASQTAMQEVTASQTAMQEVIASPVALDEVVNSQTAMQEVAASQTAMQEVAASQTAMQEVINSPTAMQEVRDSLTGDQQFHLSDLYAETLDAFAGINTGVTGGVDDIAASQTAMQEVGGTVLSFDEVATSATARNEIESSTVAINVLNGLATSFSDTDSNTNFENFKQVGPLTDVNGVWVKTATTTGDFSRNEHKLIVRGEQQQTTTDKFVFDVTHSGNAAGTNFSTANTSGEKYRP